MKSDRLALAAAFVVAAVAVAAAVQVAYAGAATLDMAGAVPAPLCDVAFEGNATARGDCWRESAVAMVFVIESLVDGYEATMWFVMAVLLLVLMLELYSLFRKRRAKKQETARRNCNCDCVYCTDSTRTAGKCSGDAGNKTAEV